MTKYVMEISVYAVFNTTAYFLKEGLYQGD